jgi:hypothetical protein
MGVRGSCFRVNVVRPVEVLIVVVVVRRHEAVAWLYDGSEESVASCLGFALRRLGGVCRLA